MRRVVSALEAHGPAGGRVVSGREARSCPGYGLVEDPRMTTPLTIEALPATARRGAVADGSLGAGGSDRCSYGRRLINRRTYP